MVVVIKGIPVRVGSSYATSYRSAISRCYVLLQVRGDLPGNVFKITSNSQGSNHLKVKVQLKVRY